MQICRIIVFNLMGWPILHEDMTVFEAEDLGKKMIASGEASSYRIIRSR